MKSKKSSKCAPPLKKIDFFARGHKNIEYGIIDELNRQQNELKEIKKHKTIHSELTNKALNLFFRKLDIYTDAYMRIGFFEKNSDEIEKDLDEIINASNYINPNLYYVFSTFQNLQKRLIEERSNILIENRLIEKFENQTEYDFPLYYINEMKKKISDYEKSKEEINEYQLSNGKNINSDIYYNILVIPYYHWYFDNLVLRQSLNVPKFLSSSMEDFKDFYRNKYRDRMLNILYYSSKVKIQFLQLKNQNTSKSTLIQYLILLLLEKNDLSIKDLSKNLKCPVHEIKKHLKGLIYNPTFNPKKELEKGIVIGNFGHNFDELYLKETDIIKLNKNFNIEKTEFSTEFIEIPEVNIFESNPFNENNKRICLRKDILYIMSERKNERTTESWLIDKIRKNINYSFIPSVKEIKDIIEYLCDEKKIIINKEENETFITFYHM